jgi:CHRD domain.
VSPSPIKGAATLTDAQIADLNAGKWYFNVHTAANPAGEIRGTVTKAH